MTRVKRALNYAMCGLIIMLAPTLIFYSYYLTRTGVRYYEDTEELHAIFPKGTSNVSFFSRDGTNIYECTMPTDVFTEYAKRHQWDMNPIQRPVKMIRYNFYKTPKKEFERQIEALTPETETKDTCFHFVKKGYYYINEKKPVFEHIAYNTDNNRLYVYQASVNKGELFYMGILDAGR